MNCCQELVLREMGLVRSLNFSKLRPRVNRNPNKQDQNILRMIVSSPNRSLAKLHESLASSSHTEYHDGQIYLRSPKTNRIECRNLRDSGRAQGLEVFDLDINPRIEHHECYYHCDNYSQLTVSSPMGKSFNSFMVVLRKNNWMELYDCKSGKLLNQVFLSDQIRFNNVSFIADNSLIVLKSVLVKSTQSDSVVQHIMIFSYRPLTFVTHFTLRKDVFGKRLCGATIGDVRNPYPVTILESSFFRFLQHIFFALFNRNMLEAYDLNEILKLVSEW